MFFLLIKRADDTVFDDFPKISDHFPKIFQIFPMAWRTFPNISERIPKITEDSRRRPKMFRSYTNKFWCSWRDKREMLQTWFLDCPIFSKLDSLPLLKENPIWNYPN